MSEEIQDFQQPTYPTHFKVVSEGTSTDYKVGPRKSVTNKIVEAVPEALMEQLYRNPNLIGATLAAIEGREYVIKTAILHMGNEAVPQLATYTSDGTPKLYKTCDFVYIPALDTNEEKRTIEEFIEGMNYLFKYFVVEKQAEDKFHIFYYEPGDRRMKLMDKFFELPKTPAKKGKK